MMYSIFVGLTTLSMWRSTQSMPAQDAAGGDQPGRRALVAGGTL